MTDSRTSLSQSIRVQWFDNGCHNIAELLLKLALNTNQSIILHCTMKYVSIIA